MSTARSLQAIRRRPRPGPLPTYGRIPAGATEQPDRAALDQWLALPVFPGGMVIRVDGVFAGAVGVAGSTDPAEDARAVAAAANALFTF